MLHACYSDLADKSPVVPADWSVAHIACVGLQIGKAASMPCTTEPAPCPADKPAGPAHTTNDDIINICPAIRAGALAERIRVSPCTAGCGEPPPFHIHVEVAGRGC